MANDRYDRSVRVSQSVIDEIKKIGMKAAIEKANSGSAGLEFREGAKRMYGGRVNAPAKWSESDTANEGKASPSVAKTTAGGAAQGGSVGSTTTTTSKPSTTTTATATQNQTSKAPSTNVRNAAQRKVETATGIGKSKPFERKNIFHIPGTKFLDSALTKKGAHFKSAEDVARKKGKKATYSGSTGNAM